MDYYKLLDQLKEIGETVERRLHKTSEGSEQEALFDIADRLFRTRKVIIDQLLEFSKDNKNADITRT
jgi:hypothetical protein